MASTQLADRVTAVQRNQRSLSFLLLTTSLTLRNTLINPQVARRETCKVVLLGQSEFEAFDVLIPGNQTFVVPHGHRLTITAAPDGSSDIVARLSPLCRTDSDVSAAAVGGGGGGFVPTWEWRYTMDESGAVRLSYVSSGVRVAAAAGALTTVLSAAQSRAQQHVLDFTI